MQNRLSACGFYLFQGAPRVTVFASAHSCLSQHTSLLRKEGAQGTQVKEAQVRS